MIKPMNVPCALRENVLGRKLGMFIRFISLIVLSNSAVSNVGLFLSLLKAEYGIYYHCIAINFEI